MLQDGMAVDYLNVPVSSSMRDWYKKWFCVQQQDELSMHCDITQIPERRESWSARPFAAEMEQVQELLELFDRDHLDGPMVALSFMRRRVQPCTEQVYPLFEYTESKDSMREMVRPLTDDVGEWWMAQLFDLAGYKWVT